MVFSVGAFGNIMASTPLVLSVSAIGWRKTFWVLAGVNFIIVLLFYLVVRDRPPEQKQEVSKAGVTVEPEKQKAGNFTIV